MVQNTINSGEMEFDNAAAPAEPKKCTYKGKWVNLDGYRLKIINNKNELKKIALKWFEFSIDHAINCEDESCEFFWKLNRFMNTVDLNWDKHGVIYQSESTEEK